MSSAGPCPAGEDITFLAHCAVSGDYSLLIDGVVKPEHMSDSGSLVAEWVLDRRFAANAEWPPTYATVQEIFSFISWPTLSGDLTGMDPEFAAAEVLYAYRQYLVAQTQAKLIETLVLDFEDESYEPILKRIERDVSSLRRLGSADKRPERFGEDIEGMMDRILGIGIPEAKAKFRMDLDVLNQINAPYTNGMYCIFGRPKSGKSWRIEYAACAYAIEDGFRGVLVDPENDTSVLETRIACIIGGLSLSDVDAVRFKIMHGQQLSERDEQIKDELCAAVARIHKTSNLVLIGKDHRNVEDAGIRLEYIFRVAKEFDAHAIYAEQIHKYIAPSLTRKNDGEYTVVRKVSQFLADSPYIVVASTQEKRSTSKSTSKANTNIRIPHEDLVFGGDGVAQNCSFLGHVQKFELADGTLLQLLTPLLSRGGRVSETEVWVRSDLCKTTSVLSPYEGRVLAKEHLLSVQKKKEAAEKEGAARARESYAQAEEDRERRMQRPRVGRPLSTMMKKEE